MEGLARASVSSGAVRRGVMVAWLCVVSAAGVVSYAYNNLDSDISHCVFGITRHRVMQAWFGWCRSACTSSQLICYIGNLV